LFDIYLLMAGLTRLAQVAGSLTLRDSMVFFGWSF